MLITKTNDRRNKMRKPVIFLALLSASLMGGRFAKADTSCNGWGSANLVQNCGFETGTFSSWSGTTTTDPNPIAHEASERAAGTHATASTRSGG